MTIHANSKSSNNVHVEDITHSSGNDLNGGNGRERSTRLPSVVTNTRTKFDRTIFPDGPMASSYENYVHNIFRPGNTLPKLPASSGSLISAHSMLRIQDLLGPAALDETLDEDIMKASLSKMLNEQGLMGIDNNSTYSYHSTKQFNKNYNSNYTSNYSTLLSPFEYKDNYASCRKKADDQWKRNNRQMIVDYKGSDIAPLTPYMYLDHPYVRRQDSRIVGSNFVQITSRPKDGFLEKIDRTLAEVRAMPRF